MGRLPIGVGRRRAEREGMRWLGGRLTLPARVLGHASRCSRVWLRPRALCLRRLLTWLLGSTFGGIEVLGHLSQPLVRGVGPGGELGACLDQYNGWGLPLP